MANQLQTPLISKGHIKSLRWKFFKVSTDSLARVMWHGDDLRCYLLRHTQTPSFFQLIVVEHKVAGRKYHSYRLGWFHKIENEVITLEYQSSRLIVISDFWTIPMSQVVRIYRVDVISRTWNRR
jgi:hypothetical protein